MSTTPISDSHVQALTGLNQFPIGHKPNGSFRKGLYGTIFILLPCLAQSQSTFQYGFGPSPFYTDLKSVQRTEDGGFLLGGDVQHYLTGSNSANAYVVKSDEDGAMEWGRLIGGHSGIFSFGALWMPGDGMVVGAQTTGESNFGGSLVKLNDAGDIEWSTRLPNQYGVKMILAPDGAILVLGYSDVPYRTTVHKIASDGTLLWGGKYGASGLAFLGWDIHVTDEGSIMVIGSSSQVIYAMMLDQNGNELWTRNYSSTTNAAIDAYGLAVCEASNGGFVLAGVEQSDGASQGYLIIRTSALGDTLWTKRLHIGGNEELNAIKRLQNGDFIIAGSFYHGGLGSQACLFRIDSEGALLWARTYGGTMSAAADHFYDVVETPDGAIVAVGEHSVTSYGNGYLVKTDIEGQTNCNMQPYTMSVLPSGVSITEINTVISTAPDPVPIIFTISTDTSSNILCTSVAVQENNISGISYEFFPNPVNDQVTLNVALAGTNALELEVRNALGQTVHKEQWGLASGTFQRELDLGHLRAGVYTATVSCQEQRYTRTFVRMDR